MSPRKPAPCSTPPTKESEEDYKVPHKKSSPVAKYESPIKNPYTAKMTDLSINSMKDVKTSSPSFDLFADFGIKPAPKTNQSPLSNQKLTQLKCCVIKGGVNSAIFFRFEPVGSWSEKIMYDEVIKFQREWTTQYGFTPRALTWFHKNDEQFNNRHYTVRMFLIETIQLPKQKEKFIKLGESICEKINQINKTQQIEAGHTERTYNIVSVPNNEMDYFWIPEDAVWADVIGNDAAYNQLIQKIGEPHGHDNFYQNNKAIIDTYFHTGTYSLDLARILHAPPEEMHPDIRFKEVDSETDEVADTNSDVNEMKTT